MNMKQVYKQHQEILKRNGFVIHVVPGQVHTHGLLENYDHDDIECVVPVSSSIIYTILNDIGQRIKAGEKFVADIEYDKIIKNFNVKFIKSDPGLRLILPDPEGQLDREKMQPEYAVQYN
jgi:hypothetical protein